MPVPFGVLALFVVFGGGSMRLSRQFVLLGGLPMCVVYDVSSLWKFAHHLLRCTKRTIGYRMTCAGESTITECSERMPRTLTLQQPASL
jgi:hypothetical protein